MQQIEDAADLFSVKCALVTSNKVSVIVSEDTDVLVLMTSLVLENLLLE